MLLRSSVLGLPKVWGVISEHATMARTPPRASAAEAARITYRRIDIAPF